MAQTVTLTWDANPLNPSPGVAPMQFSVNGSPFSVSPDRYHATVVGATGFDPATIGAGTGIGEGIFTYCYDLGQYFWGGETVTYNVVAGSIGVTTSTLAWLGSVNQQNPGHGELGWLNPQNAAMAAAIQLGIWETLYDNGSAFNLNSGHFLVTNFGADGASVQNYLNLFTSSLGTAPALDPNAIIRLANDYDPNQGTGAQDQITGVLRPSLLVPEPGTLALLALGAVVGCATRRKGTRR